MIVAEVYISGIYQHGELGDKPGLRTRYRGEEWDPASFIIPVAPPHAAEAYTLSGNGYKIARDQFPAGVAVWNEQAFSRMRDILWAGPFLTVRQKVADVLNRFDLGEGELVPVPMFKADLITPWEEPFYYINYGGPKDTFLPDKSKNVRFRGEKPETGERLYKTVAIGDGDIALSDRARSGSDIWIEKCILGKLFISGPLVDALMEAKIDVDMRLHTCRIVGA